MNERRRRTRTDLEGCLAIKRIDSSLIEEVNIDITNVSATGIGFMCDEVLEIGSVYEGILILWTKERIHVCMEIVRCMEKEGRFNYGALFVGLPELHSRRISIYQTVEETKSKMKHQSEEVESLSEECDLCEEGNVQEENNIPKAE